LKPEIRYPKNSELSKVTLVNSMGPSFYLFFSFVGLFVRETLMIWRPTYLNLSTRETSTREEARVGIFPFFFLSFE